MPKKPCSCCSTKKKTIAKPRVRRITKARIPVFPVAPVIHYIQPATLPIQVSSVAELPVKEKPKTVSMSTQTDTPSTSSVLSQTRMMTPFTMRSVASPPVASPSMMTPVESRSMITPVAPRLNRNQRARQSAEQQRSGSTIL